MNEALKNLRELMRERSIDACLVPACDYHQSEYFGPHFECTRFLSGFTGESCTLVITQEEAMLWTDGRFFVQAEEQMDPAFTLCRMGVKGVPTVEQYLADKLPEGGRLGFDGRLISTRTMKEYQKKLADKNIRFSYNEDLVGLVWTARPALDPAPRTARRLHPESSFDVPFVLISASGTLPRPMFHIIPQRIESVKLKVQN